MVVNDDLCIFTFSFDDADRNLEKAGIDLIFLPDFESIVEIGVEYQGYLSPEGWREVMAWHEEPKTWREK